MKQEMMNILFYIIKTRKLKNGEAPIRKYELYLTVDKGFKTRHHSLECAGFYIHYFHVILPLIVNTVKRVYGKDDVSLAEVNGELALPYEITNIQRNQNEISRLKTIESASFFGL